MNRYTELKQRQQREFNTLPLGFAFNQTQFAEIMENWGLDPEKDTDKIYHIGAGGYIQKKDAELLHQMRDRHDKELEDAIAGDKTGDGFIFDMFHRELEDHEFGYTMDMESALDALCYTPEDINSDKRLLRGLELACAKILCQK